jgi:hypothetical protein
VNDFGAWFWEQVEARLGPNPRRRDAADLVGVKSDNTIGNWLGEDTPKLTLDNIYAIADAFHMDAEDVVRIHRESLTREIPKGALTTRIRRAAKLSKVVVDPNAPTL